MSEQVPLPIPYPWQQPIWERLQQQVKQDKIPHAILFSGSQGIGKYQLAHVFANFLLCLSPRSEMACGRCRGCQLIIAETHPDKKVYRPLEGSKSIRIEQIRELSTFVNKTSQQGRKKVVIIALAEQLNLNAANALLKNLEEPAGDTVFLLLSNTLSAVMPTIRSRCQVVTLSMPDKPLAKRWLNTLKLDQVEVLLNFSGGAPLLVQQTQDELLENLEQFISILSSVACEAQTMESPDWHYATQCSAVEITKITEWWLFIIHGMLTNKPLFSTLHGVTESKLSQSIDRLLSIKSVNQQWLYKFSDKLINLRRQYLSGVSLNAQLVIEELLMDWHMLMRQA